MCWSKSASCCWVGTTQLGGMWNGVVPRLVHNCSSAVSRSRSCWSRFCFCVLRVSTRLRRSFSFCRIVRLSDGCTITTHTRLTAICPGLPGWADTRKVKPIWILLKQETASGSGISWVVCKSAPCSRQITTPAPHHSVIYRPGALPAAQPTASRHWRTRLHHYKQYHK